MDFPKYDSPPLPPPPLEKSSFFGVFTQIANAQIVAKAVPASGKQKYYFAMFLFRSVKTGDLIPGKSSNFTDLSLLKKEMSNKCNVMNVEYFEFEY